MNNTDFSVFAKLKFAVYLLQIPNLKYILLQYTNLQYIIANKVAIIILLQWYLIIT